MHRLSSVVFIVFILCASVIWVDAQTTEFTYQGSLKDGSVSANNIYDFEFALFDALSAGNQIGVIPKNSVLVTNGVFAVKLDFGPVFPGANRYMEVRVRLTAGQPAFTTLIPRQLINSAPYSIKSLNTDTAANATQLGGVDSSLFVQHDAGGNVSITGGLTVAGTLSQNIVNAQTQYNLGGQRILSNAGAQNTFLGINSGSVNSGAVN